ncbi:unnamed protein product [Symbiodinium sp. CCMP2592]|nr:unnamed protein product [Symbiodinium sp. CCMP2592]
MMREAGLFSMPDGCRFFLGNRTDPIPEGEEIWLENGDVIRLVRAHETPPVFSNLRDWLGGYRDLGFRPTFPHIYPARAVMLLHHTGRYMFSRHVEGRGPVDEAAAEFVGVRRDEVTFHAPPDGLLENLAYRGSNMRGLIAVVEKNRDGSQETVVLLDFRQIAGPPQFLRLSRARLAYTELQRVLPTAPPPGWRLVVQGGRRRTNHLDVRSGTVLVFGFQRVDATDPEFDVFSSSSEPGDSDDSADDHCEGAEEEPLTDDMSTRSCSHPQGARGPSPSSDRSFRGSFPAEPQGALAKGWMPPLSWCREFTIGFSPSLEPLFSSLGQPAWGLPIAPLAKAFDHVGFWLTSVFPTPDGLRDKTCGVRQHRVPAEPPGGAPGVPSQIDRYLGGAIPRALGDRSPDRPPPPDWRQPRPVPVVAPPPPAFIHGILVAMTPGYKPDCSVLALRTPCELDFAIREVQSVRDPEDRRRFPRVFPAVPQPSHEYAVLIAMPRWFNGLVAVLFDCRRWSGKMFVEQVTDRPTREELLTAAGCGIGAWLYVTTSTFEGALQPGQQVGLFDGAVVKISPYDPDPVRGLLLEQMLRSAERWNVHAQLPFSYAPAIWLLSDERPLRLDVESLHVPIRSSVVAEALHYDPHHIALKPLSPPVTDHDARGWGSAAVVIATTRVPRHRGPGAVPVAVAYDQRPILQDLVWGLEQDSRLLVQDLADRYAHICPLGMHVAFTGAVGVDSPEGTYFELYDGLCITVDFVFIDHLTDAESASEPDSMDTTDAHTSSDGGSDDSETSSDTPGGNRSRSPRVAAGPLTRELHGNTGRHVLQFALVLVRLLLEAAFRNAVGDSMSSRVAMWRGCLPRGTMMLGHGRSTSFLLLVFASCVGLVRGFCTGGCPPDLPPGCWRPGPTVALLALTLTGTRRLGLSWPYRRPSRRWDDDLGEDSSPDGSDGSAAGILCDIAFLLLTPECTPERVAVSMYLPLRADEALEIVQRSRSVLAARTFPDLVPVWPQPDARWAVCLAIPRPSLAVPVICCDLWNWDGRVFAAVAPPMPWKTICDLNGWDPLFCNIYIKHW